MPLACKRNRAAMVVKIRSKCNDITFKEISKFVNEMKADWCAVRERLNCRPLLPCHLVHQELLRWIFSWYCVVVHLKASRHQQACEVQRQLPYLYIGGDGPIAALLLLRGQLRKPLACSNCTSPFCFLPQLAHALKNNVNVGLSATHII